VPFTELVSGTKSSVNQRVNYLITSQDELLELWNMIDASGAPPTVDFTKDVVLALFAGEEPTNGFSISVSKIEDSASARQVIIELSQPGGSCVLAQSTTSPYEIVETSLTSLPLTHEDEATTTSCLE
jgi:N-acetylmuramic acid 6-phosphate (MurNAc-6-P) etherase